jgi:hypothetical protein
LHIRENTLQPFVLDGRKHLGIQQVRVSRAFGSQVINDVIDKANLVGRVRLPIQESGKPLLRRLSVQPDQAANEGRIRPHRHRQPTSR